MNRYDTEVMKTLLAGIGYETSEDETNADLILLNTCSIREKPQKRIHGLIGDLSRLKRKNPRLLLGICGCVAEHEGEDLLTRFPQLDLVVSARQSARIAEYVRRVELGERPLLAVGGEWRAAETPIVAPDRPGLTAWLTVIHGCNHHCTYCVVPGTRGREISRSEEEILADIRRLAEEGYKEVTLLGQNIDAYGKDKRNGRGFIDLLEQIDSAALLPRIRFTTSHPADLGDEFIERFGALKTICPYIHLPAQSGSNRILKRMGRGYTRERYLEIVRRLRENVPGLAMAGDIITGFPGETEEDFQETLSLLRETQYAAAFLFAYSEREGTPAAKLAEVVPPEIRNRRLREAIAVQKEVSREVLSKDVGRVMKVLVEGPSSKGEGQLAGRTRCNKMVVFEAKETLIGQEIEITIDSASPHTLKGKPYCDNETKETRAC